MIILLLALACGESEKEDTGGALGDGGGEGTGEDGAPWGGCVEVSRTLVDDLATPVAPLTFSAADGLALALGAFEGTGALRHADGSTVKVPVQLGVDTPAAVYAVDMELDESDGGSDTGPATGAPEGDPAACLDYYVATTSGTLTSSAEVGSGLWLYEVWGGDLVLWSADAASVGFSFDAASMGGDFAPDFDPSDWDTATLDVWASATKAGWSGEMQWSASKELGDGMGKGVVGPAGSFEVARSE